MTSYELGEHAAEGLYAEAQRGDVQEQDALHVAAEDAALYGSADGHALVRVDALEALVTGEGLDGLLHGGDTGGAADKQDLAQVAGLEPGVAEGLAHGAGGLFDQVVGELVELRAGERDVEVLRAVRVRGDVRQVDVGAGHAGEVALGLLGGLTQALHGNAVRGEVDAVGLFEFVHQPAGDALVKVVAAEAVVARRGEDLDDAVAYLEDGDVEGAAAEVVDHYLLVGLLVQAVGQGGRGRLVDDALDLEAGYLAGVLGGLALAVREVGRDGYDRLGDALAQIGLRVRLELLQHHGAYLLRGVALAVDVDLVAAAHLALDGAYRPVRIGDGLALCNLADHALAGLAERNDARSGARALGVGDDDGLAALHDGHAAVGGAEIYAYYLAHDICLQ